MKCAQCDNSCNYEYDNDGEKLCCSCANIPPADYCTDCLADYGSNIYDQVKGDMEKEL